MTQHTQTASQPSGRRTRPYPFFDCGSGPLFTVNPDIPIVDAMEASGCMLDCVKLCLADHAMDLEGGEFKPNPRAIWALSYLTELAYAIQSACISVATQEAKQ